MNNNTFSTNLRELVYLRMTLTTLYWVISIFVSLSAFVCAVSYALYICNICNNFRRRTRPPPDVAQQIDIHPILETGYEGENISTVSSHEMKTISTKESTSRKDKAKYRAPPPPKGMGKVAKSSSDVYDVLCSSPSTIPNSSSKTVRSVKNDCYCAIDSSDSDVFKSPKNTKKVDKTPPMHRPTSIDESHQRTISDSTFTNVTRISRLLTTDGSTGDHSSQQMEIQSNYITRRKDGRSHKSSIEERPIAEQTVYGGDVNDSFGGTMSDISESILDAQEHSKRISQTPLISPKSGL